MLKKIKDLLNKERMKANVNQIVPNHHIFKANFKMPLNYLCGFIKFIILNFI